MASWLGKVAARAREAAASVQPTQAAQRPVEDLAAELEQQARAVAERPSAAPQAAGDLLARWLEQSGSGGSGGFLLLASCDHSSSSSTAGAERVPLGFREALLRSRAFEVLLDACSRAQPLRAALQRRGCESPTPLGQALGQVAEQLLLPGALRLWPGLLEALLADGSARSSQDAGQSGSGSHSAARSKKGPGSQRWEQWARRVLAALKRGWQSEALPRVLNHLDHRLSDLAAGRQGSEKAEQLGASAGADDILRPGSGGARLSKQGIRAALARERLRTHAGEAATLRLRADLLCGACARLVAIVSGGEARAPKLERLLADADDALLSLDEGVKAKHAEQESLSGSLGELGGELQRQITGIQMTRQAFADKRGTLQDERKVVLRRLEELDVHLAQLEQEENSCANQEKKLREQLQGTTAHYEKMIASAVQEQKALADEKLRGVGYKECAHMALDVVREHARGRGVEVGEQLRRRRSELKRTLAQYFKVERLRIEVAGECLEGTPLPPAKPPGGAATAAAGGIVGGEASEPEAAAEEAWQASQRLMRRVEAALGINVAEASPVADPPGEAPDLAAEPGAGLAEEEEEAAEGGHPAAPDEDSVRQPEDEREVFEQAGGECVDCGAAEEVIWASVSHGTCLCTTCAGRHRGLGVHLSFVRSTTMDRWSSGQLRRMQLGGNAKFKEFVAGYPKLPGPGSTSEELLALYSSKAAAFYRRRLSNLCDGRGVAQQEQPPPAEEGHLPAGREAGDGSLAQAGGASGEDGSASTAEDDAGGSFSQELQALKAAHADFCHRAERRRGGAAGGAAAASAPKEAA